MCKTAFVWARLLASGHMSSGAFRPTKIGTSHQKDKHLIYVIDHTTYVCISRDDSNRMYSLESRPDWTSKLGRAEVKQRLQSQSLPYIVTISIPGSKLKTLTLKVEKRRPDIRVYLQPPKKCCA